MRNKQELIDSLRIIRTKNVGDNTFSKMLNYFGSVSKVLEELQRITKQKPSLKIYSQTEAEDEIYEAEKHNINIVFFKDANYPSLLRRTENFPPVLYVKGNPDFLKKASIAVVGSRNASIIAKENSYKYAEVLGSNGMLVVSGLAKGVDAKAHEGSLNTGTIAVLGNGVNYIYPAENKQLYNEISERGALVSDFLISSPPLPHNFPKRNKIIAGMARGVLVVEAGSSSGSLITAELAANFGREVFAIPSSPSDPKGSGTNKLIKDGACLVESPQDILSVIKNNYFVSEDYNTFKQSLNNIEIQYTEEKVEDAKSFLLNNLSLTPVSLDLVLNESSMSYNDISLAVIELEITGKVQRYPGNRISLN